MNGYKFDNQGNIVPCKVTIVCGPPASGKTTYVRENRAVGDLVVDLDLIKQAISMCDRDSVPTTLLPIAKGIRKYLLEQIGMREMESDAWVIVTSLKQAERMRRELRATVVHMLAGEEECMARAIADDERTDKELQGRIIREWFEKHGSPP